MIIELVQETPHPVYEIQGYAGLNDFNDIIAWLHRTDLPDDLSLSFEGTRYRFQDRIERVCWALGFDKAFDLLSDEPELQLFVQSGGPLYLRLGDSDDKNGLERLKAHLLQELFLTKWPEHDEDFKVYCAEAYVLLVKQDVWSTFSLRQKHAIVNRCKGFCDALDT